MDASQVIVDNLPLLLRALVGTLQISIVVIIAGSVLGVFVGLGLLYGPGWLRAVLRVYSDVVRGLPLLVLIFIIYYVPATYDIDVNAFAALTGALSLFAGAHIGEIVRGAVSAVPRGQSDAARAIGLTFWPRTWSIVLPQALPAIVPPWTNTAVEMVKASSLGYLLSVNELLFGTYKVVGRVQHGLELYLAAAAIYFIVNYLLSRFGAWVEQRVRYAI
jgi:polar amino acid transport system permease protein